MNFELSNFDILKLSTSTALNQSLFDEYNESMKFKNAVAKTINCKKYLEFGISNGMAPIAFLDATPKAHFITIDYRDKSTVASDQNWISKHLERFNYHYYFYENKKIKDFSNDSFDLIHIQSIGDPAIFYKTLIDCSMITEWIMISNYLEDSNLYYELNHFLRIFNDVIDFHFNVTNCNKDLLIKLKNVYKLKTVENVFNSSELIPLYDSHYYLNACGGCYAYIQDGAHHSSDSRILSLLAVVFSHHQEGRLLDLGCGRGEVCVKAAIGGFECTGIDYSKDAIAIAKKGLPDLPEIADKLNYMVSDVSTYIPTEKFEVVVASDVVEHMTFDEVSHCYEIVSRALSDNGIFIIHTFPNSWYYDYFHSRRRKKVSSLGGFLPTDPRSRFEKNMHINEQNPRVLFKQLKQSFQHVLLWFNSPDDPIGSLQGKNDHHSLSEYRDLFAIASNSPIDIDSVKESLGFHLWGKEEISEVILEITQCKENISMSESFDVCVRIENRTRHTIHSLSPNPINLSYHWLDYDEKRFVVYDGLRTSFSCPVRPGSIQTLNAKCIAPDYNGEYLLRFALVQEQHAWFDQHPFEQFSEIKVTIS